MSEEYVYKVTSLGQIAFPKKIREELGIEEDDNFTINRIRGTYFIKKLQGERPP